MAPARRLVLFLGLLVAGCGSGTDGAPAGSTNANGAASPSANPPTYATVATVAAGGEDGYWDYLSEDPVTRQLYVTHGTQVLVIDMDADSVVGTIPDLPGVRGFAVAHDLNKGFASNGRENTVAVVDLTSLKVTARVPTEDNPDGILYVPELHEVYAFNGRGHSATVIDAVADTVVATIPLPGKPEFAVWDPTAQRIYNNIEDQNEIVVLDPASHSVVATWPIAPGEAASGLAIDVAHHRLFAVCENGLMVMVNSETGAVVTTIPIGEGPDAARFDPATQLAFSSNGGDGTVTIAHEDTPDQLTVVQTLETARSARTMTLDPTTHRIYLSAADFGDAPPPDSTGRRARPPIVPGSFKVLVFGPAS